MDKEKRKTARFTRSRKTVRQSSENTFADIKEVKIEQFEKTT